VAELKSDISDWEIVGEQVGSGSFGVTYRCKKSIQIDDGEVVTRGLIKLLKPGQHRQSYKEEFSSFLEEIRALSIIESRFVAKLIDAGYSKEQMWLVTEFVSGLNLQERLKETGKLQIKEWLVLADNTLRGLNAIHEANFVHLDLKPSNIMYGLKDESYVIVDLGISKFQKKVSPVDPRLIGAHFYMPPEGFDQSYNSASDIFTLGTTLHQALFGFNLWHRIAARSGKKFETAQAAAKWAVNQPIPSDFLGSHPIERILRSMLDSEPNVRPSARVSRKQIEDQFNLASHDLIKDLRESAPRDQLKASHMVSFETWTVFESRVTQLLSETGTTLFKLDVQVASQPDIKFSVRTQDGKRLLICSRAPNLAYFVELGWAIFSEREMRFELEADEPKHVARIVRQALETGYGLSLKDMQVA
jgi:serine/threonine protein kinase